MRTTNINISLDLAKEGKWYAQEKGCEKSFNGQQNDPLKI